MLEVLDQEKGLALAETLTEAGVRICAVPGWPSASP